MRTLQRPDLGLGNFFYVYDGASGVGHFGRLFRGSVGTKGTGRPPGLYGCLLGLMRAVRAYNTLPPRRRSVRFFRGLAEVPIQASRANVSQGLRSSSRCVARWVLVTCSLRHKRNALSRTISCGVPSLEFFYFAEVHFCARFSMLSQTDNFSISSTSVVLPWAYSEMKNGSQYLIALYYAAQLQDRSL